MGYVNYYLKECQNTKEIKREKIELAKQIATEDIKYINRKTWKSWTCKENNKKKTRKIRYRKLKNRTLGIFRKSRNSKRKTGTKHNNKSNNIRTVIY